MDYTAVAAYFVALVAYAASPGPLMAVLVARSLGKDWKGATAFAAGLSLGEVIAVVAVVLGLGIWAQSKPELLALAKYMGVIYLLWLSLKMWNDRSDIASAQLRKTGLLTSVGAGLALCLGNPATLLMQMVLLPIIAPDAALSPGQVGLVVLVTFVAFGIVFFGTIPLARQFNRIISSPGASSGVNRVTAAAIAATSVWILAAG
jgi:threonine/homoserine/homoserine lactone efflux protein